MSPGGFHSYTRMLDCACWSGCRKSRRETDSDGKWHVKQRKSPQKTFCFSPSQQKPDRTTTPFRNACSQFRRCRCLIVNKHGFLPSSSASSTPTEIFHHKPHGETTRLSSSPYLYHFAYTVKDISQSRTPFPSLQTAPGTTVIGQETQFMHLLMSNEASPPSHLWPSHLLFPGRSPA